ncbi:MAG: RNase adapter RapZ [Deltaproteobacteria bacterium]|nr:MAG: RNase adapter RapZ [Deltaproteobacteria bacterium]
MRDTALQVVIVTGLSGSGKSTAIRVLEDLGFYCIDNLPVVLTPKFIELCQNSEEQISRVALGVDLRERGFLADYPAVLDDIRRAGHRVEILYLDAADDVLVRRFSETRRPHPLAEGTNVAAGIRREREKLADLKGMADRIIDTSAYTVHQLRDELRSLLGVVAGSEEAMRVFLVSFGYKYGLPSDTDMVLDVRFLPNPFFVDELRPLDGTDTAVARYVLDRGETRRFLEHAMTFLDFALPLYEREGKRYLTIGIGCTGGRHRSVAIVGELERRLAGRGYPVAAQHRDVERP